MSRALRYTPHLFTTLPVLIHRTIHFLQLARFFLAPIAHEIVARRLPSARIPYSAWQPLSASPPAANAALTELLCIRLIHWHSSTQEGPLYRPALRAGRQDGHP